MGQCKAKSKQTKKQCKNWAIRNKLTCRFHGGLSTGPRTKKGKENSRIAHVKHGLRTKENLFIVNSIRNKIQKANKIILNFKN